MLHNNNSIKHNDSLTAPLEKLLDFAQKLKAYADLSVWIWNILTWIYRYRWQIFATVGSYIGIGSVIKILVIMIILTIITRIMGARTRT